MWEQRSLAIYSFSEVLQYLKIGHKAKRKEWKEDTKIIYDKDMGAIYKIYNDRLSPWEAPQGDLLAEDWVVIKSV